ncbi:MAG: hypothetical protein JXL84_13530, partial [Deltaproteobacteria bacterium]|nr:hypothetical protein [Deltaproteobacteria bacterium]
ENAAGRTISSVARTARGDVIGHNAMYNTAPFRGVYEAGAGVVHAAYRGGAGIFSRLVAHGQEVAAGEFGGQAVFGESVCNHIFSQKMCHSLGWTSQALEVDLMPASAYEREKSAGGRVASLLDFKTLRARPHRVFIPPAYEEDLKFFYAGLDDRRELVVSAETAPPESTARIETQVFGFAGVARLAVWETGADFAPCFEAEEKGVIGRGATVLQVWLNISRPWATAAVDILREKGYFLGGILPRWFDHDGLLMQKMLNPPDWDGIRIHFERAGAILGRVKGDWLRAVSRSSA